MASLLLFVEEEDAFWLMCTVVEDLVPTSYYSSTLIGVQVGRENYLLNKLKRKIVVTDHSMLLNQLGQSLSSSH